MSQKQKSILGFFRRTESSPLQPRVNDSSQRSITLPLSPKKKSVTPASKITGSTLTPAPSSDAVMGDEDDDDDDVVASKRKQRVAVGLPSPITPATTIAASSGSMTNSPSRKVRDSRIPLIKPALTPHKAKKVISYAESDNEDDESDDDAPAIKTKARRRLVKRQRTEDSEDAYSQQGEVEDVDEDDSEDEAPKRKRKRASPKSSTTKAPSPPALPSDDTADLEIPTVSTAQQWNYDPDCVEPYTPQSLPSRTPQIAKKQKAHVIEPEKRHPWLANPVDGERRPPGHPDFDPRTIYVPPVAFGSLSPFEQQYWSIKKNFYDTIVFFKKGKFYELYEHDATIGHQLFDLKLTDRVNMRMVGVPESSLNHWATQFVAKGYKIARVDQKESALAKEMRERDTGPPAKPVKKMQGAKKEIIQRELACVLTSGTLVDGGMLQDDMSTYCVAIKEAAVGDLPEFGIAFVDAATGQFLLTHFVDDLEYTKFETFVAQTRPQELLLTKPSLSTKALRILKNNTGPTTLWNYLKPGKEFWDADITCREIDRCGFFANENDEEGAWPEALQQAREKETVMSSFGALTQYLRLLKIDRELITLGNFRWYDPILKASSLILDGQTLINLEIFANSFDGTSQGTLFSLLNRCVTPFGKRMFKLWMCHPLMDVDKINARLDAVDALNADPASRDQFTLSISKIPDLERLLSRVHAGACKPQDFVRVLEGFEQIDYTMSLLGSAGEGDGLIGQLVKSMPDITSMLQPWKTAFDHAQASNNGIVIPETGVEDDFDESQARIEGVHASLDKLLKKARKDLNCSSIVYRDNGKEIKQLEVPVKVKGVPHNWDQMSATKTHKRYYSPELRKLVRELQEAQETHAQIVRDVHGRFLERFDRDYMTWLTAVKIVAQLDCLISLAKSSSSLGEPACRPTFLSDERSVIEFTELRHPCMLPNVTDFIPNDVLLGGSRANLSLLTGANAAGKSTVLRMTCVAVIMAQMGCYVPCSLARLTPVDRIMSRLGANDNIFAAQSTFFVELAETKKILSEATPRSLVILDELGRGTSSYDGVAVAQAVLHHVATHVGCTGFFATHYHSLAEEFSSHPEITPQRMRIHVDEQARSVTFLYKLEAGVAEGSFGMHCASMCGIPAAVVDRAEVAAKEWEHTSKLKTSLEEARQGCFVPLGLQSDVAWLLREGMQGRGVDVLLKAIAAL